MHPTLVLTALGKIPTIRRKALSQTTDKESQKALSPPQIAIQVCPPQDRSSSNRTNLTATHDSHRPATAHATTKINNKFTREQDHRYDTDSYNIGIDNHASYCMSNAKADFTGPLRKARVRIKGVGGNLNSVMLGTLRWTIQTDAGKKVQVTIPNLYYVPVLPIRLLSPQHLAQEMAKIEKSPGGT